MPRLAGGESHRVHLVITALTSKPDVDAAARAIRALAKAAAVISEKPTGP